MNFGFTESQSAVKEEVRSFTREHVAPFADEFDLKQKISDELIRRIGRLKYLGAILPKDYRGLNWDMVSYGILNEEIGKGCSSVRSLFTVHGMCSYAIMRWGTDYQKEKWLPKLATGELIGAFALSEPDVGSDAKSIRTQAKVQGDDYVLNGKKKWITFGQIADLFLVIAQINEKPIALIVENYRPGFSQEPITDLLGTRGSMLSTIFFKNCRIPGENLIGGPGFGFSAVALSALDIGRFSVACGSVGIAQACCDASVLYANERKQFGTTISGNQLIRRLLADMDTKTRAARLLCFNAAYMIDSNSQKASKEIMRAKYFAGKIANDVARDAVQIHGANGCSREYPVERYFRDAKIMEIIEGANQMLQIVLGKESLSKKTTFRL